MKQVSGSETWTTSEIKPEITIADGKLVVKLGENATLYLDKAAANSLAIELLNKALELNPPNNRPA